LGKRGSWVMVGMESLVSEGRIQAHYPSPMPVCPGFVI
jgi:hypothetical protein